ncbi:MAG: hypothetical protein U0Q16_07250 [Bryobacteraceae bacterium]
MEKSLRVVIFIACVAVGQAQHQHAAPAAEKPVTLMAGLGKYSHPIRTSSAMAQKFFDQGLTLLYGFNRYEALRSFRRAAELDPKAAMPHWGIAMAQGPHINMDLDSDVDVKKYCESAERALQLATGAEKQYAEAALARCPQIDEAKYTARMRELAARLPDDPDAATLFAESAMVPVRWRWWTNGKPNGELADAIATLERVLRRYPEHPGANHFYIHAVEMSPSPELAVPSAQRLMGVVPNAGHLVHMPAHIWLLLGEWELAASTNERAVQLDQNYFKATGVPMGSYAGYMVHNMHFVAYARSMQGRGAEAMTMARAISQAVTPMVKEAAQMVDPFTVWHLLMAVRFEKWDEILAAPQPDAALRVAPAIRHWARALALLGKKRPQDALAEKAAFEDALSKVPVDWNWLNNKARDVLAVAAESLEARMAANPMDEAMHWNQAVALQDNLVYDEPPPWFYPIRESLGGALLRAGQAVAAEQAFREGLRRSPQNGRMLFGLLESLQAQGKTEGAAWVRSEFERAWKRADTKLAAGSL